MTPVLAAIPYTTFPIIDLGILQLRTFGVMVATGVLLGAWLAARHGEGNSIPRDTTYALAMRMVLVGIIGSRITWVLTHLDDLASPLEALAIWKGGLQFSGGFLFAVIAGYPVYRHWNRLTRWSSLDGYAYGLTLGLAVGRVGCYAVGEHFGSRTSFPLAVRYDGGSVRETVLGARPLETGLVFHQTSLYELMFLLGLFGLLTYVLRARPQPARPGTAMAIFTGLYGVGRFATDALRVNDERVLGLTGAQYLCVVLVATSAWIWFRVRPRLAADLEAGMLVGIDVGGPTAAAPL